MTKGVTILTGFLGAGKTTLLNAIICSGKETVYAIIENEIGQESIDSGLILSNQGPLVELNNGCLCCSLNGDLFEALEMLSACAESWDELIIEATGIADPANIAMPFLTDPQVAKYFRLKKVICVVDAEQIEDQLKETVEAIRQISFSDILLINKAAQISEEYLVELRAILISINPFAKIVTGTHSDMGVEKMSLIERNVDFQTNPRSTMTPKGIFSLTPSGYTPSKININEKAGLLNSHSLHEHSGIETLMLRFSAAMDVSKLERVLRVFLLFQAPDVYRLKGFLYTEGSGNRVIVQSVGQRLAISEGSVWKEGEIKESKVVIIGKNLQREGLENIFIKCLSKEAC